MKFNEIQDLIKLVSRSNVNEVEIEQNETKITIRSDGASKRKKKGQKEEEEEKKSPWDHMPFPMMYPMPQMGAPQQQMQPPQPQPQEAPQPQAPQQSGAQEQQQEDGKSAEASTEDESKYVTVKSPMIGTFYRSPSPDKDSFVNVGDTVKEGDVLCIIEAMKLFNEIEAEQGGKIVKVLVDDSSPVEYDQPLFLIDPS